jgi:hypothetical protein
MHNHSMISVSVPHAAAAAAAVVCLPAGVFFGSDFVTITKSDDYNWPVLKPDVFAAIMDHFSSGEPLFTDKETLAASDTAIHEDDDEVGAAAGIALLGLFAGATALLEVVSCCSSPH